MDWNFHWNTIISLFPRSSLLKKLEELMGKPDPEAINILLAHNPKYGRTYFRWGADLILSGHYPWRVCSVFSQTCGSHQLSVYTFSPNTVAAIFTKMANV